MDIHFGWQACDSSVKKIAFCLRGESILLFKGRKKIRKYDFQSSQANIHPAIFSSSRSFSARVLLATQRPQTPTRQRYDAMSNCKPKSTFLVHLLVFLVEHGHWSPFLKQSTHLRTLHFTHLRALTHRRTHAPNLTHLRIPSSYRTTFQPSM